jgi:hypothetical protein
LKHVLNCQTVDASSSKVSTQPSLAMIAMGNQKGWEYKTIGDSTSEDIGPQMVDFFWAKMCDFRAASKNDASGSAAGAAAGAGGQQPSVDLNAQDGDGNGGFSDPTRMARANKGRSGYMALAKNLKAKCANGSMKIFSMPSELNCTDSCWRDCIYKMAQPIRENMQRVPERPRQESFRGKPMWSISNPQNPNSAKPIQLRKDSTLNMFPSSTGRETGQLADEYVNPPAIGRIKCGLTIEDSQFQRRLDYLNMTASFPTCVRPQNFKLGTIIDFDQNDGSVYFNKWASAGHQALVVEIGSKLSTVPGLAGQDWSAPDTLRGRNAVTDTDVQMEGEDIDDEMEVEDEEEEGMRDHRRDPVAPGSGPSHLQDGVERPGAGAKEDVEMEPAPEPGISARSEADRIRPDSKVRSMVYDWDMFSMFMTIQALDTLHHDWQGPKKLDESGHWDGKSYHESQIEAVRRLHPDVYRNEDLKTTLRDLPQVSLRYPAKSSSRGGFVLVPLTRELPLTMTRESAANTAMRKGEASGSDEHKMLVQVEALEGRCLDFSSPEYRSAKAKQDRTTDLENINANVFSRSAWLMFTLEQMSKRGMNTEAERERARDQDIYSRLRIRNARAARGANDDTSRLIGKVPLARLTSMLARERNVIAFAENPEGDNEYANLERQRIELSKSKSHQRNAQEEASRRRIAAWTRPAKRARTESRSEERGCASA